MMLKFKKIISIFIIFGLLLSYFSYSAVSPAYALDGGGGYAAAAAGWAHFAKYVLKEFILDLAARLVARLQLTSGLNGIAQQIIQSGRTGRSPAFVQNWRNFITDSEYRGEDVFRSILANTANCPHIRNDLLGMFGVRSPSQLTQNIRTNNLDPYTVRGRCTLPAGWSLQNYNNDFAGNGGWEALARLAQPQNNFYGSTIMALGELDAQRNLDRNADRGETAGNGFTGVRRSTRTGSSCDTPPLAMNSGQCRDSYLACTTNADCLAGEPCLGAQPNPSQARCTFMGSITTPSKVLGEGAASFIDKNLSWLTTTDEISEVLGSFLQAMYNKLLDYTADTISGGTRPGTTDENIIRTQTEACVRTCNNTSTGSQMMICIDRCYKASGVDSPNNYNSTNFTGTAPPPTITPTPIPGSSVQLCADVNFGGLCETFAASDFDLVTSAVGNDQASSLRVPAGQTVILCAGINSGAPCVTFSADDADLSNDGFPDSAAGVVSSIQIGGGGGGGTTECNDGIDNDGDNQFDYPNDPECTDANDNSEAF